MTNEDKNKDLCTTCENYWKDFPMPCEEIISHCTIVDERFIDKTMDDIVSYPCVKCPFDSYKKK